LLLPLYRQNSSSSSFSSTKTYRRIAGYFRSSVFELVDEEIEGIDSIEIVCNSDLDPRDITASRLARRQPCSPRESTRTEILPV
jgi:hypothetical protein